MGWELGSGLGHIMPLLAMARCLREQGHESVLALRNVGGPASLLRDEDFPVVQAPLWIVRRSQSGRLQATATFADILVSMGFADGDRVRANLTAWDGLFDITSPDLVVSDHSPGLCLAARGRVPVLTLGNGFTLPPPELEEFPCLQPGVRPLLPQPVFLARLNAILQARGVPSLPCLAALYDSEERYVHCLPLLDPYGAHREPPADGPLDPLPTAQPAPPKRRAFVYYGAEMRGAGPLMEGLVASGLAADVYLRGATAAHRRALDRPAIRLFDSPPPLEARLAECSFAVHHGGPGTAAECLAVGRPQFLVPLALERRINARALCSLGVARALEGKFTAGEVASALLSVSADEAMAAKAEEFARGLDRDRPNSGLESAVERCLSLIGR